MRNNKLKTIGAALLAIAFSMSCGEAADIDRTQPNRVDKEVFEGEWWARSVVVDKQIQTTFPFIGFEGNLERIRWEVTQTRLLGYRSFERLPGSEGGNPGEQTIIAVFPIISHFDVTRAYNPVNGVEQNMIIENTFDRPWWERQFVRVDWSRNLAEDPFSGVDIESSSVAIVARNANSVPTNPWKVRVLDSDADDVVDYIETTTESVLAPSQRACGIIGDWYNNCLGSTARVKHSFRRIPNEATLDYEPMAFPDFEYVNFGITTDGTEICYPGDPGCEGSEPLWVANDPNRTPFCDANVNDPDDCQPFTMNVFAKFGYFRTDRFLFDRENGITQEGRERLINRWNIWEQSMDENGVAIPFADRTPKPITYYTNVHFPDSLMDAVQDMAKDWDVAYRDTVAELKDMNIDDVQTMYEVIENNCSPANVQAYIDENSSVRDFQADLMANGIMSVGYGNLENACAVLEHYSNEMNAEDPDLNLEVFHWEQLGDLRHSFVTWLPKAELAGPLGYGPSAADPITGEIVSANANIYGASIDTYSNYGADIVDLLNGRITETDVINGTQVRDYIASVRSRYGERMGDEAVSNFIGMVKDRSDHMSDEKYLSKVSPTVFNERLDAIADTGFEDEYLVTTDTMNLFGNPLQQGVPTPGVGEMSEKDMAQLRPSSWARQSIPAEMLRSNPNQSLDDIYDAMGSKLSAVDKFQRRQDMMDRMNACFDSSMVEPAVADLAASLGDLTREEAVQTIRSNILRAVLAHEVGHTLGLRHNFDGSTDALNFFPQFWGVDLGDDDHRMSHNSRREEVQYSSIMDYHQRFNSDFGGIGLYDKAAIKFGYGELLEVFDEGRWDPQLAIYEEHFLPYSQRADWTGGNLSIFLGDDLPYLFGGTDGSSTAETIDDHYDAVLDAFFQGDRNAVLQVQNLGIEPKPENMFKRRNMSLDDFRRNELNRVFGIPAADGSPPAREVPYQFCSDVFAAGNNVTCNRWDKGYTSEQIVGNVREMYDFYYPFTAFRAQRGWQGSPVNSYIGRFYGRTVQPMLNAYRSFYFFQRSSQTILPLVRDWAEAAIIGANFLNRIVQTPEPGNYCRDGDWYVPENEASSCDDSFELGIGDGRFYDSAYTDELGFRMQNVGHMWDKIIALQAMTSSNSFFQRDFSNFFSRGAFNIGYYRLFEPEIVNLYGSLIMGDEEGYAAQVAVIDDKPQVSYQPLIDVYGDQATPQGVKIKPTDSYVLRYYAMIFAMSNLTSNQDQTLDFSTRARISLVGSRNDPVIDPSIQQVVFTDPQTQYSYRATAIDGTDLSVGYKMLVDAQTAADAWNGADTAYDAALAAYDTAIEGGGDGAAELEAVEAADNDRIVTGAELNEKVQLIDTMRQLADLFEYSN